MDEEMLEDETIENEMNETLSPLSEEEATDALAEEEETSVSDKKDAATNKGRKNEEEAQQARDERKMYLTGLVTGVLAAFVIVGIAMLVRALGANGGETIADVVQQNADASQTEVTHISVVNDDSIKKLQTLEAAVQSYYYEPVDEQTMEEGMYKGLLSSLGDPYTEYYSQEAYRKLLDNTAGTYYGIGAYIGMDKETGYTYIAGVIPGAPAEEAGFQTGDLISAVDGEDAFGFTTSDASNRIRGPKGTQVVVTIFRKVKDSYDSMDITVTRDEVVTSTIDYEMLEDGIARIWIHEFDVVTEKQFTEALAQAREEGMRALIIDVRDNPGGNLDTVVQICRQILPEGLIVYKEDKYGKRVEYRNDVDHSLEVPLVLLTNGNSASASEILAGAIRDYGIGTLIGTTTYGKGIVQSLYDFYDGSAIKVTTAKYFTPSGENIHGTGIAPDIEEKLDYETYIEEGIDNQLNKAVEFLKEKLQ